MKATVVLPVALLAMSASVASGQSRAEFSGIGSLRAIISAEMVYASICGHDGYAISLEDLARPLRGGRGFISPDVATNGATVSGYKMAVVRNARKGVTDVSTATEGRWNDFDVALFDYRRSRNRASYFGVIVSLPNDGTCFHIAAPAFQPPAALWQTRVTLDASGLASWVVVSEPIPGSAAAAIGPRTAALLRDGPPVSLETNLGFLFVTPMPRVTPDRLPDFLNFATSVARALGTDAHKR